MLRTLVLQGGKYYAMKVEEAPPRVERQAADERAGGGSETAARPASRASTQGSQASQTSQRPLPGVVAEIPLAPIGQDRVQGRSPGRVPDRVAGKR